MSPSVSVIVAIYNAERFLHRCLDSLKNQTLKDMEFILVDDGSTDSSLAICQSYAEKDSRFKVFHKQNEGVSATRQFGLDRATGVFVIHLDADDFVGPRLYEEAFQTAKETHSDIIFFDILRFEPAGIISLMDNHVASWSHKDVLDAMVYKLFGSLCNRLVRRSLFEEYGIVFPERMQYLEDKLIMIRLLSRSYNAGRHLTIRFAPHVYLYYDTTANDSSLTKVGSKNKFEYRMNYWRGVGEELDTRVFGKTYYSLLVEYAFNVLWNHTLTEEEFKSLFSPFKKEIKEFVPIGIRKAFVLNALDKGVSWVDRHKWMAYPLLVRERIRIFMIHTKGKCIYRRICREAPLPIQVNP